MRKTRCIRLFSAVGIGVIAMMCANGSEKPRPQISYYPWKAAADSTFSVPVPTTLMVVTATIVLPPPYTLSAGGQAKPGATPDFDGSE